MHTGDEVQSSSQASFSRLTRSLSVMGWKVGPRIRGLPESVKKIAMPPNHRAICTLARVLNQWEAHSAKAAAPPELVTTPTKPPMKIIITSRLEL